MKAIRLQHWIVLLCGVLPWFWISTSHAVEDEELPKPISMEVFLKIPTQNHYEFHIHLTNSGDTSLVIDLHDLPWLPPNDATWLTAFRQHSGKQTLTQLFPIGEYGYHDIPLLPGESVQGKMTLNDRFPTLSEDIAQHGVTFEWSCDLPSDTFLCKEANATMISIPLGAPGNPDPYFIDQQACRTLGDQIGLINTHSTDEVLFILMTEDVMRKTSQVTALLYQVNIYVEKCKPMWTNSWAVSFFTDPTLAGYLNESNHYSYFERGLWQQANIGKYSSQIRTLFRFPWSRTQSDEGYISVYQLNSSVQKPK